MIYLLDIFQAKAKIVSQIILPLIGSTLNQNGPTSADVTWLPLETPPRIAWKGKRKILTSWKLHK